MKRKRFGFETTKLTIKDLTARELSAYNNTDPLEIYEIFDKDESNPKYDVEGVVEISGITANEVKEILDILAVVNLEHSLEDKKYEYESNLIESDFLDAFSKALSDNINDGAINVRTMIYYLEKHPEFAIILRNCGINPDYIY